MEGGDMGTQTVHRTSLRLVSATIALAAIPMGATAMSLILPELRLKVMLVGVCTAVLSVMVVRSALRKADSPRFAALLTLAFAVVAAILNSPMSFVAACVATVEPEALLFVPVGIVFATVFGSVFAVPLGVIFGAVYATLVGSVFHSSRDAALEAPELTLRTCGVWLGFVSVVCYVVGKSALEGSAVGGTVVTIVETLSLAFTIVGFAAAAFAQEQIMTRRSWIRRVRLGFAPGWEIVELDSISERALSPLRPLLTASTAPRSVLVRRIPGVGKGAYRTGDQIEPIALL